MYTRKKAGIVLVSLLVIFSFSFTIFGQQESTFNFSKYEQFIEEKGIPTMDKVEELRRKAEDLFEKKEFKKAESALKNWAYSAELLSNIISAGLEHSYDNLTKVPSNKARAVLNYDDIINDLKTQRNKAYIKRAESLVEIGEKEEALILYLEVLGLITFSHETWDDWTKAANSFFSFLNIPLIDID